MVLGGSASPDVICMDDKKTVVTDPDPTEAVKEALTLAIRNLEDKFDRRFEQNDEAVKLARAELRDQLQAAATANEKLVDQLAKANQVALTAALQTQKESAAKSELSIADIIRQLQAAFESANKATNEKIDRLTSRLDLGEGRIGGADSNRRDERQTTVDNRNYQAVLIGLGVTIVGLIVGWLLYRPQK